MKPSRFAVCALVFAALQWSGSANAACYAPNQQMSPQAVSDFLAQPSGMLGKPENANGGDGLTASVQDLVASNPSTLPVIIGLLSGANPQQQKAIGAGLAGAANFCISRDPALAGEIQKQVVASNSTDAKTTFAALTANLLIGSVGGGAGVSGGSVGGQTSPTSSSSLGSSSFQALGSSGVLNASTNFFTSSVGSASSASRSSAATSVSP
jgi:hypothetical protein